jgi:hypothetical protein
MQGRANPSSPAAIVQQASLKRYKPVLQLALERVRSLCLTFELLGQKLSAPGFHQRSGCQEGKANAEEDERRQCGERDNHRTDPLRESRDLTPLRRRVTACVE